MALTMRGADFIDLKTGVDRDSGAEGPIPS